MYALPHIQNSIDTSSVGQTDLSLDSGTHGPMKAYISSTWNINEPQISQVSWLPSNPAPASGDVNTIIAALNSDMQIDWSADSVCATLYIKYIACVHQLANPWWIYRPTTFLEKWALVTLVANEPSAGQSRCCINQAFTLFLNRTLTIMTPHTKVSCNYFTWYSSQLLSPRIHFYLPRGLPTSEGDSNDSGCEYGATYCRCRSG